MKHILITCSIISLYFDARAISIDYCYGSGCIGFVSQYLLDQCVKLIFTSFKLCTLMREDKTEGEKFKSL